MNKYNYYLEKVARNRSNNSDIHKAVISCREHKSMETHLACIVVYGNDDQLTERVIKVLEGLNE